MAPEAVHLAAMAETPPRNEIQSEDMEAQRTHQYPTRHSFTSQSANLMHLPDSTSVTTSPARVSHALNSRTQAVESSPVKRDPKEVTFELLFSSDSHCRARLPMKVNIFPHDNTDGIVSTVKNFFGLYNDAIAGVSFEDAQGITMIANHENFTHGMTVYVRVIPDRAPVWRSADLSSRPSSPLNVKPERVLHLAEGFSMNAPMHSASHGQQILRPHSRVARCRSTSPRVGMQRSASSHKHRARTSLKKEHREASFQARLDELNSDNAKGYVSSDGEEGSVSSSFKARNEPLASAEISVDNIVEGGRRPKAKFESSELPLFVLPQMPAANSTSSVSPQRRANGHDFASPAAQPPQRAFGWGQNTQSPQLVHDLHGNIAPAAVRPPVASHGHSLRDRVNSPRPPYIRASVMPRGHGLGILPTPDPTIASTISDEDVALQLMRLGDLSNMSHGRKSGSTMDDALSGRAELGSCATSDEDQDYESEGDSEGRKTRDKRRRVTQSQSRRKQIENANSFYGSDEDSKVNNSGTESQRKRDDHGSRSRLHRDGPAAKPRSRASQGQTRALKMGVSKPRAKGKLANTPVSSLPATNQLRKTSSATLMAPPQLPSPASTIFSSNGVGFGDKKADAYQTTVMTTAASPGGASINSINSAGLSTGHAEEDLSSKPRCQRCRKSKKGCDRQRPCGRCVDAGIGADGCVSEDEGNGRKGRFGRHMGVPLSQVVPSGGSNTGDVMYQSAKSLTPTPFTQDTYPPSPAYATHSHQHPSMAQQAYSTSTSHWQANDEVNAGAGKKRKR